MLICFEEIYSMDLCYNGIFTARSARSECPATLAFSESPALAKVLTRNVLLMCISVYDTYEILLLNSQSLECVLSYESVFI